MISRYILKWGVAIPEPDLIKWAQWMGKPDRIIEQTTVEGLWVSTVFLGLDHNWGEGEPLLFETMVFSSERGESLRDSWGWEDLEMRRYSTLEGARAGHDEMVAKVRALNDDIHERTRRIQAERRSSVSTERSAQPGTPGGVGRSLPADGECGGHADEQPPVGGALSSDSEEDGGVRPREDGCDNPE